MQGSVYLALLAVFVPLSLLSVGGGAAVLPEMHRQTVLDYHWITEAQFVADYAISRMSPGPGSLIVTLIGFQAAGFVGAMLATVGIFLPSSVLMYALVRVWARSRGAPWQKAVERGLAPIAAGLILASCVTLLRAAEGGWLVWVISAVCALLVYFELVGGITVVAGGAAVFLLIQG
jgi:chromate transporter